MSLDAIGSATSIALASTVVTLLVIKTWQAMSLSTSGASSFPNDILFEAGQRHRDEFERLRSEQGLHLILALMFAVTLFVAALLNPQETIGQLQLWQTLSVLAIVGVGATYVFYRFVLNIFRKRRLRFVRDANIAIGHSLQCLTDNQNRVFHDVKCATGIIDNIVIGLHGIYAVFVISKRPNKDNRVRLSHSELSFAPGGFVISLGEFAARAKQFAKLVNNELGHQVLVRPVIAVPGWEIESQASEEFLLVNERNVAMLRGWRDEKDYLMNDEVETIQTLLRQSCMRSDKVRKRR